MAVADPSPSLEILVREPEGFSLWTGPPFSDGKPSTKLERAPCINAKFSDDGSKLIVMKSDSVISIYDCRSSTEIKSFEIPNVLAATLSPRGTYLQTFQKASSPQDKNVTLWKIGTGDSVYHLFQKNMTKTTWPSIRFSSDEAVACRLATNEIQFFDGGDFSKGIINRLRVPGVAAVELSKNPGSYVATFVPESKGIPASVQIFPCEKDSSSQPVARRSFFRCSTVQLNWNCGSTGLLAVVQSDVDKTNQSYYGESKLNYLTTDGLHEGVVPLRKEGPVHDVQWSFSGSEFAVVYGFMPAKATVFDRKCNPLLELGTGPYNTIRWNPKGRFLCLAGFGNLPGDMAFWDYLEKRQLGTTKAECSVTSEWSPDGRYFMTATTAPRLQVDNGIKIFHPNGSLYFKKMFDKLYQAEWKPESPDRFGDIAELTKSIDSLKVEGTKIQVQGSKSSQASARATSGNPSTQKVAAYRPPHAKNAEVIRDELFGGGPAQETSKNALRNKKKREKQREKKAAEAAAASGS
ncbi:eukaryotic translation initiation factor 2A [Diospyros lotus]|uniref:eukaryotic translation initiation factor 2A n=1 Tax=Diospyros lotus TaxID=55363 RepID=UPI00224DD259|nr:eukaryotic translation initiation factor 2A [Diospyros lotus]